jgi:small subunit ribosomal protein S8
MYNDPISDMLTRIRNAVLVRKTEVMVPFSGMKWQMAKILKERGYLESFEKVASRDGATGILIQLKYDDSGVSAIRHIQRVSTPGRRLYVKKSALPVVLNNLGISIISTPQGLMTSSEARKRGLGGEVICEVY